MATIRNPLEWGLDQLRQSADAVDALSQTEYRTPAADALATPVIRHITLQDLRTALMQGLADFGACRSDVVFIGLLYPLIGLLLAKFVLDTSLLPLLFPLISGFALVGPIAGIGLYEMSRRHELGQAPRWIDALAIARSPALGPILVLAVQLLVVLGLWLVVAQGIYNITLGPQPPLGILSLLHDALTTGAGWMMIILGCGVGFLFAVLVLMVSVVSFPLLIDRRVSVQMAITTSVRAVLANPLPMAAWGLIVALGLALGSLPALLGLIVVVPVLGHATWHLYRAVVAR